MKINHRFKSGGLLLLFTVLFLTLPARSSDSPEFGDPASGLTPEQLQKFENGAEAFAAVEDVEDGVGPVFNGKSCGECHAAPALGGGSTITETRFGFSRHGKFDPLEQFGGSLIQQNGVGPVGECNIQGEEVPSEANVVALRLSTPLFGLGLVDAVPDAYFFWEALRQRILSPKTAGVPNLVTNVETGRLAVGKFGWKAQVPTLFQFAGDAYLNEMGITSPFFPNENPPQGNEALLACDPVADPEDNGEDVEAFRDFMTFLAPPPRGLADNGIKAGERLFQKIGCASCHQPNMRTGPNRDPVFDRVTFHPYSDFLLHDMGQLGDGIAQGRASGRQMRTAPLWGLGTRTRFLHDGRATTIEQAISAHDGQGVFARKKFNLLNPNQKKMVLRFLDSL